MNEKFMPIQKPTFGTFWIVLSVLFGVSVLVGITNQHTLLIRGMIMDIGNKIRKPALPRSLRRDQAMPTDEESSMSEAIGNEERMRCSTMCRTVRSPQERP